MKMPTEPIAGKMLAPCGMNCAVCYRHLLKKKPCGGCRACETGKPERCRRCKIKDCAGEKGLDACFFCIEYPCKQIKSLDRSYRGRYRASLIENGLFVKENGLAAFMEQQKQKYTCLLCGGVISLHDAVCSECGQMPEM